MDSLALFWFHDTQSDGSGARWVEWGIKMYNSEHGSLLYTLFYVSCLEIVMNATDVSGLRLRQLQQSCSGRSADRILLLQ